MNETTKQAIIRKLTSRKLWLAVATFVSMAMVYSGEDKTTAEAVSALIIQGGCVIAYILAEGWADAEHATNK